MPRYQPSHRNFVFKRFQEPYSLLFHRRCWLIHPLLGRILGHISSHLKDLSLSLDRWNAEEHSQLWYPYGLSFWHAYTLNLLKFPKQFWWSLEGWTDCWFSTVGHGGYCLYCNTPSTWRPIPNLRRFEQVLRYFCVSNHARYWFLAGCTCRERDDARIASCLCT